MATKQIHIRTVNGDNGLDEGSKTSSKSGDKGNGVDGNIFSTQSMMHDDWSKTDKHMDRLPESGKARNVHRDYYYETTTFRKQKRSYERFIILGFVCFLLLAAVIVLAVTLAKGNTPQSQRVVVLGELVLLEDWSQQLADKTSEEYIKKKSHIENEIDVALRSGTSTKYYKSMEVVNLRQGSVIVDIIIILMVPPDGITTNGTLVLVTLAKDSKTVDVTSLIKESITGSNVNLMLDADKIKLWVSGTDKMTTVPSSTIKAAVTSSTTAAKMTTTDAPSTAHSTTSKWVMTIAPTTPSITTTNAQPPSTATPSTTLKLVTTTAPTTSSKVTTIAQSPPTATTSTEVKQTFSSNIPTTVPRPTTITAPSPVPTKGPNDTTVFGSIAIDRRWNNALQNKSSPDYVFVDTEFRDQLQLMFDGTSLDDRLTDVLLLSVSSGSIVIKFRFKLNDLIISNNIVRVGPTIERFTLDDIYSIIRNSSSKGLPEYSWENITLTVNQCGTSKVRLYSNYIQDGRDALIGQWPWQAHIKRWGIPVCGGTLINRQWVITAGHCVSGHLAKVIRVVLGSYTRAQVQSDEREYSVSRVVVHHNYTRVNSRSIYDIALLLLDESVTFNDYIQPACLPRKELSEQGTCYVTGWGQTKSGSSANVLQQIPVTTYRGSSCDQLINLEKILDNMICASSSSSRYAPSCSGDSGGPLVCLNPQGRWDVHGVISFGPTGCQAGWIQTGYAVLTGVYHFKQWMDEVALCYFTCGDGSCLYSRELICDGTEQCDDGTDEGTLCAEKPTCDFEYTNMCGYSTNGTAGGWTKVTILDEGDIAKGTPYDHTTGRIGGSYMQLEITSSETAVLLPPRLETTGRPICMMLYFYIHSPYFDSRGSLQIQTQDTRGNQRIHWSVNANFGKRWNFMSVTLPSDSEELRIVGSGKVAVDDVVMTTGECPLISCTEDEDVKCESLGLCFSDDLQCDGQTQCVDNDEDPTLCGETVNCTFSNEYMCGYKRDNSPAALSWVVGIFPAFPEPDHTNKPDSSRYLEIFPAVYFDYDYNPTSQVYANLKVPSFTTDKLSCFEFYFVLMESNLPVDGEIIHDSLVLMSGDSNGSRVELWARQNNQGLRWHLGQVQLEKGSYNLTFVASLSPRNWHLWRNWLAQISVDDARLIPGICRASVVSCSHNQFQCTDTQCIHQFEVCNGVPDCVDGNDEYHGCTKFGTLRLTGGLPHDGQGRFEIYRSGGWQTFCDLGWNMDIARLACQALGYGNDTNPHTYNNSEFGEGIGPIWTKFECFGNETEFEKCFQSAGPECTHDMDLAISCLGPANFENTVRLKNDDEPWMGVVEIIHNGTWGAICNAGWNMTAANIVCTMLGYTGAVRSMEAGDLGQPADRAWLAGVTCQGQETGLHQCEHGDWGLATCPPAQYAAVECVYAKKTEKFYPTYPTDYIRLVDGTAENDGRVEILIDGQWGTICNDKFGSTEADVVCKTLGYSGKGEVMPLLNPGRGPIFLDEVQCDSNSTSLFNCSYYRLGIHDCDHYEDVHVRCEGTAGSPENS